MAAVRLLWSVYYSGVCTRTAVATVTGLNDLRCIVAGPGGVRRRPGADRGSPDDDARSSKDDVGSPDIPLGRDNGTNASSSVVSRSRSSYSYRGLDCPPPIEEELRCIATSPGAAAVCCGYDFGRGADVCQQFVETRSRNDVHWSAIFDAASTSFSTACTVKSIVQFTFGVGVFRVRA